MRIEGKRHDSGAAELPSSVKILYDALETGIKVPNPDVEQVAKLTVESQKAAIIGTARSRQGLTTT